MSRNMIVGVVVVLAAVVVVLGTLLYQERNAGTGVDIRIGSGGVSIRER